MTRITTHFRGGLTPLKHRRYTVRGVTRLRNAGVGKKTVLPTDRKVSPQRKLSPQSKNEEIRYFYTLWLLQLAKGTGYKKYR